MKKVLSLLSTGLVLSLFACGGMESDLDTDPIDDSMLAETDAELGSYNLTRSQRRDVTRARAGTARYNYFPNALDDGYVNTGLPCIEGQGYHYIRPDLVGTYDVAEAPILMYDTNNRLIALEWATPVAAVDGVRPVLFDEVYHGPVLDPPLFVLHVWAWLHNPAGAFADANPNVHCN